MEQDKPMRPERNYKKPKNMRKSATALVDCIIDKDTSNLKSETKNLIEKTIQKEE